MTKFLVLFAVLFLHVLPAQSQSIIVSEYYNEVAQQAEWTELVVIQDNLDIRGFVLFDYGGGAANTSGGIRFKSIPLWSNLRSGTVIVVNHAGNTVVDGDPKDGYIEFGKEATALVDTVLFNPAAGVTWTSIALNLNQTADIIRIVDANGAAIHALAHGQTAGPLYDSVPFPKTNFQSGINGGQSVRYSPGATLADFSGPSGTTITWGANSGITKGLPNRRPGQNTANADFWRSLRQPSWVAPSLTIATQGNQTLLTWNKCFDPNPADGITGYMILRDSLNGSTLPADGTTYSVGQRIGTSTVVAFIRNSATTTWLDPANLSCTSTYYYRVFAFRYDPDLVPPVTTDAFDQANLVARARAYQEVNFASGSITKTQPPVPSFSPNGQLTTCQGESILLIASGGIPGQYQWSFNGGDLPGETGDTLRARFPGTYTVKIVNSSGCVSYATINANLNVIPQQIATIIAERNGKLCSSDSVKLTSSEGNAYQWYLNDSEVAGATSQSYSAKSPGTYRVRVTSKNNNCISNANVTVSLYQPKLTSKSAVVSFDTLGTCEGSRSDTVTITNTGSEVLTVTSMTSTSGFAVTFPKQTSGFQLLPGQTQLVRLMFTALNSGITNGELTIVADPCSTVLKIPLTGYKAKNDVRISVSNVDFGRFFSCLDIELTDSVIVGNDGALPINIDGNNISVTSPFYFDPVKTGSIGTIAPGSSKTIFFGVTSSGATGTSFLDDLKIPYTSNDCRDTVRVSLRAQRVVLSTTSAQCPLVLPPFESCRTSYDTVVTIRNESITEVIISEQPTSAGSAVVIQNLPVKIAALDSAQLLLHYVPTIDGNFSIPFAIKSTAGACSTTVNCELRGVRQAVSFSTDKLSLDFGSFSGCNGEVDDTLEIEVCATNPSGANARILGVGISFGAFFVDAAGWVGKSISPCLRIPVRFQPPAEGDYVGTLSLTLAPCDQLIQIPLQARRTRNTFSLSTTKVRFGTALPGSVITRRFSLVNRGISDLEIDQTILGIVPPFSIQSTVPNLPTTLKPGDSVVVIFAYSPTGDARDSLEISLSISKPCNEKVFLSLTGDAQSNALQAEFYIPTSVTGSFGSLVEIPVISSSEKLNGLSSDSLVFAIGFDPQLLAARTVKIGDALDPQIYKLSVVTLSAGTAEIHIVGTAPLKPGTFCALVCEVLLGNSLSCPLTLSPQVQSVPTLIATGRAGKFTVLDECRAETRLVDLSGNLSLSINGEQPVRDQLSITYEIVSEDGADFRIVNGLNQIVFEGNLGNQKAGAYQFTLPVENFTSGFHHIVLRNGISRLTGGFLVLK